MGNSAVETGAVDICVCTFRRPQVAETLRALSKLFLKPDWKVRVIVADNDDEPSAKAIVEATARDCALPVTYIHAPARNIAVARNACLDAATAPLLAFIDDDETPIPEWLEALITALRSSKADIVLGPVQAVYPAESSPWLRKGDFHSTKPWWVGNEIMTGYTGNVIFRRLVPALQGRRFRIELGRSGGEDAEFFAGAKKSGAKIAYAPRAVTMEFIPASRANLSWLLKRRFRFGQTSILLALQEEQGPGIRMMKILVSLAKVVFCMMVLPFAVFSPDRWRFWLLRGVMHAGAISRLLGMGEAQLYGQ